MKKAIDLSFAKILSPAEMNKIHFGGNVTPLTPEQIEAIAHAAQHNQETSQQNETGAKK